MGKLKWNFVWLICSINLFKLSQSGVLWSSEAQSTPTGFFADICTSHRLFWSVDPFLWNSELAVRSTTSLKSFSPHFFHSRSEPKTTSLFKASTLKKINKIERINRISRPNWLAKEHLIFYYSCVKSVLKITRSWSDDFLKLRNQFNLPNKFLKGNKWMSSFWRFKQN